MSGGFVEGMPPTPAKPDTQTNTQLARPFAGEATHRTDFSTAHGAYESGVRGAEEAIGALAVSAR
jgi:hypothetical protein